MSTISKFRGHRIEFVNNMWIFEDTKLPISDSYLICKCKHCNEFSTIEGHDSCLGVLKGVTNACCGHGNTPDAYIQLLDGSMYFGKEAVDIQNRLKVNEENNG